MAVCARYLIHGTLGISSIIIAGAAGMVLGKSHIFPGTYKAAFSDEGCR